MELPGVIGADELIVVLIVIPGMFLLPIAALVDIVRSKFEGKMQLLWIFIVF